MDALEKPRQPEDADLSVVDEILLTIDGKKAKIDLATLVSGSFAHR